MEPMGNRNAHGGLVVVGTGRTDGLSIIVVSHPPTAEPDVRLSPHPALGKDSGVSACHSRASLYR